MPCLCTTNTLKLFIRTIAQVDVLGSNSTPITRTHLRKVGLRNFTTSRTFHQQHDIQKTLPPSHIPLKGSTSNVENDSSAPETLQARSRRRRGSFTTRGSYLGGAIAEISLEAIDEIVAESELCNRHSIPAEEGISAHPNEGIRSIHSSREQVHKRSQADMASTPRLVRDPPTENLLAKTLFRRTKVANTSFELHYSSPRTPSPKTQFEERPGRNSEIRSDIQRRHNEREGASKGDDWAPPPREHWQIDKAALKEKFPGGWKPQKRLSPDALAGIRALHAQMPEKFTTSVLAESFKVSPDAIRRILKSKWSPDADEEADRQRRWFNRGKTIYTTHAEKGQKPPKKWRELGIGDGRPEWMLKKRAKAARSPLAALITTARRREREETDSELDSLADRIL